MEHTLNFLTLYLLKITNQKNTMMMVALGSFGISISFPTGPVIFTSAPGFKSPEMQTFKATRVLRYLP